MVPRKRLHELQLKLKRAAAAFRLQISGSSGCGGAVTVCGVVSVRLFSALVGVLAGVLGSWGAHHRARTKLLVNKDEESNLLNCAQKKLHT